jgi:hypothetical protein
MLAIEAWERENGKVPRSKFPRAVEAGIVRAGHSQGREAAEPCGARAQGHCTIVR